MINVTAVSFHRRGDAIRLAVGMAALIVALIVAPLAALAQSAASQ